MMVFEKLFSEFLTARYNPLKGEIEGCTPNTFYWWHEKGHEYQHRSGWGLAGIGLLGKLSFVYAVYLAYKAGQGVSFSFADWMLVGVMVIAMFYEAHAWWYAFKNYKYDGGGFDV